MTPAMLVMVSVIGVAGVGYAAWLGTTIVRLLQTVFGIEKDVKSLLETRTAQTIERGVGVDQRLADLERGSPPPAPTQSEIDIAADAADATAAAATDKAGEIRKAPKS